MQFHIALQWYWRLEDDVPSVQTGVEAMQCGDKSREIPVINGPQMRVEASIFFRVAPMQIVEAVVGGVDRGRPKEARSEDNNEVRLICAQCSTAAIAHA